MNEVLYFKPKESGRYPFTYANDQIRLWAKGTGNIQCQLSRADASVILSELAPILGMKHRELAEKIADHYIFVEYDSET